jgi:fructuronate reductase
MADGTPIVHLGLGAFARAHLATYAQDLLAIGVDARITAVSLRNPTVPEALAAQGHRYTVVERDGHGGECLRTIDAIVATGVGAAAAIDAICAPDCRMVTLTVTEAGYVPSEGDASDGSAGGVPVADVLAEASVRRRRADLRPVVVASLDNLSGNGRILERLVARSVGTADVGAFPSSVVDRIVPAAPADLATYLADVHGVRDELPVLTEPHRSWAIEAAPGLPPLARVGVDVVADVAAHERRKLWLLNGPHSAAALAGLDRGHETIAEAMSDEVVASLVGAVAAEALEVADLPEALDGASFVADVLDRFRNPVLGHRCAQVATDSDHKLPLRIVPVVEAREARGLASPACRAVLALWPGVV